MTKLFRPKPKCPICNILLKKKNGRLECICGFHCHPKADRCCKCGIILDEEK